MSRRRRPHLIPETVQILATASLFALAVAILRHFL